MNFTLNDYHRNVPDEELLKDVLRVAQKLGKDTLTGDEYKNNGGKYHPSTITNRFGGWINALKLCGLSPAEEQLKNQIVHHSHKQKNIPDDVLLEDLRHVAAQLNKASISCKEYDKHGHFSDAVFFSHFKTWNNALAQAGLTPFEVPSGVKVDGYKLLEEIERLWISLGRQPTCTDIKSGLSKYSLNTYLRCFGTWRKALEFFVAYMNGEQEVEKPNEEEYEEIQLPKVNTDTVLNDEPAHRTRRDVNLRLRFNVLQRDSFKCCMCGRSPATTPGLQLQVDHIVPWSKGGETVLDNLQTLCCDCNLGKGNLTEDR